MAFNISISGLKAAQKDMGVISNNIANVGTVGFKRSDALFSELYTAAVGSPFPESGQGVTLEAIRSDFSQGNFEFTSSQLDLAIDGKGLFVLEKGGVTSFTRAGAFRLDGDGYVVTDSGHFLQGYRADANGVVGSVIDNLQITDALLAQRPTEVMSFGGNLDSRTAAPAVAPFEPGRPETYNFSSTTTIFDAAGDSHLVTLYFVKSPTDPNQYTCHATIDNDLVPETGSLQFNSSGALESSGEFTIASFAPVGGVSQALTINFSDISNFGVNPFTKRFSQDGFPAGALSGFEFDRDGIAYASYTNGEVRAVGQVALAEFANPGGLDSLDKTKFAQSDASGVAKIGPANSGSSGFIRSSALESANVDLTVELLALIEAQRNFQSNAQAIQNENDASQTILQLR